MNTDRPVLRSEVVRPPGPVPAKSASALPGLKRILRLMLPPLVLVPWEWIRKRQAGSGKIDPPSAPELFDGEGELFMRVVRESTRYAEYGVGLSTRYVANETSSLVRSVDTSLEWIEKVRADLSADSRFVAYHVDLGPVGEWGTPVGYERRHLIDDYLQAPFRDGFRPDCVLVDGRFRVAAFLTALLTSDVGTRIVFDDYVGRKYYHVVEEILRPSEVSCRQALFVVPSDLNHEAAAQLIRDFRHVMD